MNTSLEHAASQRAAMHTDAWLRAIDGHDFLVPRGPLEIEFGNGVATVRWKDAQGTGCSAAIHPQDYERYVAAGWIRPSVN